MELTRPAMLICETAAACFALPLAEVAEILPILPMWRPPTMPRPLVGFVMVRGAAVAVLSPTLLFDGEARMADAIDLYAHLVRLRSGPALLVDRAAAIVPDAVVRAVTPDLSWRGCVTGVVETAGGDAHLLSVARRVSEAAQVRIDALTAEAGRRAAEWAA